MGKRRKFTEYNQKYLYAMKGPEEQWRFIESLCPSILIISIVFRWFLYFYTLVTTWSICVNHFYSDNEYLNVSFPYNFVIKDQILLIIKMKTESFVTPSPAHR